MQTTQQCQCSWFRVAEPGDTRRDRQDTDSSVPSTAKEKPALAAEGAQAQRLKAKRHLMCPSGMGEE